MRYLDIVNGVLRRLRETEVESVNQTPYSRLIGDFVNQTKREVEDSYNWNVLTQSLTVFTTADLFNYVLVGSGSRFKVIDVLNLTQNIRMVNKSREYLNTLFLNGVTEKGAPVYYGWNGVDTSGDFQVDLWPSPDKEYHLQFNMVIPQNELAEDNTRLMVPYEPVLLGTYAKAIRERGEDQGNLGQEVQGQYLGALASAVAQEQARYPDEAVWYPQ